MSASTYYEQAGEILIDDVPGPFLFNDIGNFVVNPNVTGYTPTATEVEWPGQHVFADDHRQDRVVDTDRKHGGALRNPGRPVLFLIRLGDDIDASAQLSLPRRRCLDYHFLRRFADVRIERIRVKA